MATRVVGWFRERARRRREEADRCVLGALTDSPFPGLSGFELLRLTGLSVGRLYPALDRLEARGLVDHYSETVPGYSLRPPRRLYKLVK